MKKTKKLQDVGEYGSEDRDKVAAHLFETIDTAAHFYLQCRDKWRFGSHQNESLFKGEEVLPALGEMVWNWHIEFERYLLSSEHLLENAYRLADKEGITAEEAVEKLMELLKPTKPAREETVKEVEELSPRKLPAGWPLDYS